MTQYPCIKCWGSPCHCMGNFEYSPSFLQLDRMTTLQLELLRDSINQLLKTRSQKVVYTTSSHMATPIQSNGVGFISPLMTVKKEE